MALNPIKQPELGQRLHDTRVGLGMTQQELREKSHVSVRTIQRIESGAVIPRTVTIKILLKALGENVEDWYNPKTSHQNMTFGTFKNIVFLKTSESALKEALFPAWVAGIVYLLLVLTITPAAMSTFKAS